MESKQQLVDSILESVRKEVSEFVAVEGSITSSIEYEEKVLEVARKFAKELVLGTSGELPQSRNAKKKC